MLKPRIASHTFFLFALMMISLHAPKMLCQDFNFELKTSPSINMIFNTVAKYQSGLVQYNYMQLNVETDRTWDLYVGTNTSTENEWDEIQSYSTSGITPPSSLVQLRFRNGSSTPNESGFFPLQDNNNPTYLIGTSALDDEIPCANTGTNAAGSYTTSPGCYQFNLDLLIQPGFSYRPGLYRIEIVFTLMENL